MAPHDTAGTLDLAGVTVEQAANPGSRGNFGKNTAHYTKVGGSLFPAMPTLGDIKQQELADCYVLGSVLSILARPGGDEVIEGMMRDRGTDVVVRLYDKQNTAHYVSIEKSIRKNSNKHNGGAIWASLLEKAYAAASFVEEGKKFAEDGKRAKDDAPLVTGWAKLSFGGTDDAMQVLLGQAAKKDGILDNLISGVGSSGTVFSSLFYAEKTHKMHESVRATIRDQIFGGNGGLLDRFLQWRTDHVEQSWRTLLEAHGDVVADKKPTTPTPTRSMRLDDFYAFLTKHALAQEVAAPIMDFAEKNQLLPGRRGTGAYSTSQLASFKRIKDALASRYPVALSSKESVGTLITRKGKSGGESIVKGLAANHAYAVISIKEDLAEPRRKWIRVRNPWGETGRGYQESKTTPNVLKAVEITAGEFDLELSDLSKRFASFTIGGVAIST